MDKDQNGFGSAELLLVLVIVGLIVGAGLYVKGARNNVSKTYKAPKQATVQPKSNVTFDHIVIIVEENKGFKTIMEGNAAPYFQELAATYSQANNYFALFHPSLPNYLAMIGGTNGGIQKTCSPGYGCEQSGKTIVNEIEKSNRTWKGYMESMPAPCGLQDAGKYAVRHNPFVYYKAFSENKEHCNQHDVPLEQLYEDIEANRLPNYSFITPNLCNDMHDCSVSTGDAWLADIVPKLLGSAAFKTKKAVLVITWDEAEQPDEINQVPTVLVGSNVKRGYKSSTRYDHYSILRTIEDAWQLPALTENDKKATPMNEFFVSGN